MVALGLAFGLGAAYGGGGMKIFPPQAQQFAADAPATTGGTGSSITNAPAPANSGAQLTTEQVVDQVGPAVVTVVNKQTYTGNRRPGAAQPTRPGGSGSQPVDTGLGSGVIFDKAGYILTNNHVVEGATAIDVELADGTRVDGTLVGRDPRNDVAVVKIDPAKISAVAALGDSSAVRPGQRVVAIGSPEGYENTVTEGVVSGVNRQVDSYIGLIQTDAAINHGNSGGPLLNASGQVIGLNTLGLRDDNAQGLNFAIPINMVKDAANTIISKGNGAVISSPRAYLGVQVDPRNTADGAHIQAVNQGTPAAKAGLQAGDVITAVNGTKLDNGTQLGNVLSTLKPGDTVTLTVNRNGSTQTLTATLVEYPANP
jgi:S1-C subfamily serine protease